MGMSFVVSVFLQTVRGYSAIETGVVFTAATVGVLVSSLAARATRQEVLAEDPDRGRLRRHPGRDRTLARLRPPLQGRRLRARAAADRPRPGRDADPFGERRAVQLPRGPAGEISGLSRSVSNLGSSFGTAIAGTILVSVIATGTLLRRGDVPSPCSGSSAS